MSWAEGEKAGQARLTDAQVREIRTRWDGGNTGLLAAEFGITPQYVSQLGRRIWRKSA